MFFPSDIPHSAREAVLSAAVFFALLPVARCDPNSPIRIVSGPNWIPIDYRKGVEPGSALDFSVFGLADAPAGKHGWLEARGEHFVFPDSPDIPRRFYGPNLVFDACCPVGDDAEMLADRLVRMGYNSVRLHGWDGSLPMGDEGWTKKWNPHEWAPEKIDRMDRFCATCFARGIYVTTDLFVSRETTWGDIGAGSRMGHASDEPLDGALYKAFLLVDDGAFADWQEEARKFLLHENPYTGRTYAAEPGMPFLCLVNETNLASQWKRVKDFPPFRDAWREWSGSDSVPDNAKSDVFAGFEAHLEARFFEKAKRFLREELGVKALLTDQNIGQNKPPLQRVRERLYDYNDGHTYEAHPEIAAGEATGTEKMFGFVENDPTAIDWMGGVARANAAIVGKPTTVSEWDYCYPARSRSCAGLIMGSLMAQQDFSAGWRYGWICSRAKRCRELKDEFVFAPRPFSALTDPVALATDKIATLLFLRRDAPAFSAPGTCLRLTEAAFKRHDGVSPRSDKAFPFGGVWQTRFAQASDSPTPPGWREIRYEQGEAMREVEAVVPYPVTRDPATVFRRDPKHRSLAVETPRTCGGFAFPESGTVEVGPLSFRLSGSRATVCVASVDPDMRPISDARRLLVMHLTDLQGEDGVFADETFQTTLEKGVSPLVADGEADVSIMLANPERCRIHALSTDGQRIGEVPYRTTEDGALRFTASVQGPDGKARMYYEIERSEGMEGDAWFATAKTAGIVSISGTLPDERMGRGVSELEKDGFRVKVAPNATGPESVPAAIRARILETFWLDPEIDLLVFACGGEGASDVVPLLDWKSLRTRPDLPVVGFSDVTVLLGAMLFNGAGHPISGPMLSYADRLTPAARDWLRRVLAGEPLPPVKTRVLHAGSARGTAFGGHVTRLHWLWEHGLVPSAAGRTVFLECTANYDAATIVSDLDAMRKGGFFNDAAAVVVCDFRHEGAERDAIDAFFRDFADAAPCPVFAGFPYGHVPGILALDFRREASIDPEGTVSWSDTASPIDGPRTGKGPTP